MIAGRCSACLTPTRRSWHRYCASCFAWLRFGQWLRVVRLTRQVRL